MGCCYFGKPKCIKIKVKGFRMFTFTNSFFSPLHLGAKARRKKSHTKLHECTVHPHGLEYVNKHSHNAPCAPHANTTCNHRVHRTANHNLTSEDGTFSGASLGRLRTLPDGFVGSEGNDNSQCQSPSGASFLAPNLSRRCFDTIPCHQWKRC